MRTKAVVFPEADRYQLTEVTLDEMRPDDISVRTLVSAISPGTERWILRGKHIGTRFPCVPGYHRIGIVDGRGADVVDFEVGDIVYGAGNRWKEDSVLSMWGAHIGHSVSQCAGYWFLASSMPNQFELETLSFSILCGVANRGIRFLDVQATQKVLIIGAGIIGICAAQLVSLEGAQPVLLEKDAERREFVEGLAPSVLSPDADDLEERLQELAPTGFDVLYDTAGHAPTTDAMVKKMKRGGRVLLQAQYFDKGRCALDLDQIKVRELTLKTTCGIDDQDFFETVANLRARRLRVAPLITHRFSAPEGMLGGYDLLGKGKPFSLGIVFLWEKGLGT